MYTVYALADPRTEEVHYIGCTLDVKRRFNDHLNDKKGNVRKRAWINSLKKENLLPTLIILEEGLKEPDAWFREAHWIQQYVEQKAPLTNTYLPEPEKTVKRLKSIYHAISQEHYDYLVSLEREAVLIPTEEGDLIMSNVSTVSASLFDAIRHTENNQDFWSARDLQSLLGYAKWERFEDAIERAKIACQNSGHEAERHFPVAGKTSPMPNGGTKEIKDYHLSRYACYLTAMNGDPRKPEISSAQTYFAVKTREAEVASVIPTQQEPSLAGDDFLSEVRILLHVPTLKELQVVDRYIRAAKALYQQKDERITAPTTKQLLAPKSDKDTIEQLQAQILKHLGNHGPLTFNTLYHSYMKNRDEMAARKALDVLVGQGVVQKEITSHSIKYSVDAVFSQQA